MLENKVQTAISSGESFLLACQANDGFWRDYQLEPGPAEAWTTACTSWVLTYPPPSVHATNALRYAADSLHQIRKTDGWGYNRNTAADADSTAWVWRSLAALDDYRSLSPSSELQAFLNSGGGAQTFRAAERFGIWANEHSDVTPIVGLALLAAGAEMSVVDRVRKSVLKSQSEHGNWRSFWWTTDAYATAQNLEFLAASGAIPANVGRASAAWLECNSLAASSFEAAQLLVVALNLIPFIQISIEGYVEALLRLRLDDHSWTPSATLLVPKQRGRDRPEQSSANLDVNRVMSTTMAVWALKKWLILCRIG